MNYQRAYGDFNLIPLPGLTMVVRYRYNNTTENVPASVTVDPGRTGFPNNPINTRENKAEVAFRYSPVSLIAFKAEYSFDNKKRYNADLWSNQSLITSTILAPFGTIPSEQNIHKITAGVTSRPARWVDFNGSFEYAYTEEPAYAIKPKNSYKARADANFMPLPEVTANAHYRFSSEENGQADMHTKYDNPGVQAVWSPAGPITISANYDYFRYRIKRDVALFGARGSRTVPGGARAIYGPGPRIFYRGHLFVRYTVDGGYGILPELRQREFQGKRDARRVQYPGCGLACGHGCQGDRRQDNRKIRAAQGIGGYPSPTI